MKELLKFEFDMKDFGVAKKILGVSITRNKANSEMKLSQSSYLKKVIFKFSMKNAKPATVPLRGNFKLSSDQYPTIDFEKESMLYVSY